ncbi:MAG: hypothetical protein IK089_05935, partial [Oxalobacter sp.]|nr:hypothetical protein [Oxalobacter sp.]
RGFRFEVIQVDKRRIKTVRVTRIETADSNA